jgi:cobalt-precorrin 5A hydrolase
MDKNRLKQEIAVGIGCKKGVTCKELLTALKQVFQNAEISGKFDFTNIRILSSINIKQNELGLLDFSKLLNKELKFYSAEVLRSVEIPGKSEFVNKITGTYSVAEASAILSSKKKALIVPKQKFKNITIAVAE